MTALATPRTAAGAPVRASSRLISSLAALDPAARRAAAEAWVASRPRVPVHGRRAEIDGVRCVATTFVAVHGDEAEEVMLHLNSVTDGHRERIEPALMSRLAGTDLWHLTYDLPVDLVASYRIVAGDPIPRDAGATRAGWLEVHRRGRPDPHNPLRLPNPLGETSSVLVGPEARVHPVWTPAPAVARGVQVDIGDPLGDGPRHVWLDAPADAEALLVLFDGETWRDLRVEEALRRWDGPRLAVACVANGNLRRRAASLPDPEAVGALLERGVLPAAARASGRRWDAGDVIVAGQSFGGLAAAGVVVTRPDLARTAIVQSGSFQHRAGRARARGDREPGDLLRGLAGGRLAAGVRIAAQWGTEEAELGAVGRAFVGAAREAGAEVVEAVYAGGHDYAWWRTGLVDALTAVVGVGTGVQITQHRHCVNRGEPLE